MSLGREQAAKRAWSNHLAGTRSALESGAALGGAPFALPAAYTACVVSYSAVAKLWQEGKVKPIIAAVLPLEKAA